MSRTPSRSDLPVDVPGARLAGTLVRPAEGVRSLLVLRTPYDRTAHLPEAMSWARRGVAVLVQDVRGRHGSTGRWEPYRHETGDGLATLDHLAAHFPGVPVAVGGGSYAAGCARAVAGHPSVRAVISSVPATSPTQTILGRERVPHLHRHAWWWTVHGVGPRSRPSAFSDALSRRPDLFGIDDPMELERALDAPGFAEALDRAREEGPAAAPPDDTPRLELGGWWDPFVDTSWDDGATPHPGDIAVTIGPWAHDLDGRRPVGLDAPEPGGLVDIGGLQHRWLASALRGVPERLDAAWVGDGWLPTATPVTPRTHVATVSGRLVPSSRDGVDLPLPGGELPWTHEPGRGLPGRCWPVDVTADGDHPDCLRFESTPVRATTRVLGRFSVSACVRSASSTTGPVVARVSVRRGDGPVVPLTQGVHPGHPCGIDPVDVRFDTRPTGAVLDPGDSLVLDLAGGAHPLHPRAPRTVTRSLVPTRTRLDAPVVTAAPAAHHPWKES